MMMSHKINTELFKTPHDAYMFAFMHLAELAEIYWFRNENEITKGNKVRSEFYVKKYHEVHDTINALYKAEAGWN